MKVGEVLAVLEAGDGASGKAAARPPSADAHRHLSAPARTCRHLKSPDVRATPTARNVAREQGVKLESVAASGPQRPGDERATCCARTHLRHLAPAPAAPQAPHRTPSHRSRTQRTCSRAAGDPEERVRMSKRRADDRAAAGRGAAQRRHAHHLQRGGHERDHGLRERRKEAFKKQYGVGLGIASFFVKASIGALKAFPQLNAEIQGDEIVFKHYYDIGMAVGAEGGLVVPVIRDADRKTFAEIELAIRDFAKRAQDGTLTLEDLKGGTFTITNGGVFGSLMSTPILNPPQVGILGLHKIQDRVGRRQRPGRHPADDVSGAQLRPPHRRRPRSRAVPVKVKDTSKTPPGC